MARQVERDRLSIGIDMVELGEHRVPHRVVECEPMYQHQRWPSIRHAGYFRTEAGPRDFVAIPSVIVSRHGDVPSAMTHTAFGETTDSSTGGCADPGDADCPWRM
jgi:hypothetical protein